MGVMTQLLESVIERVRQLPAEQQDAIAQSVLDQLEGLDDDAKWNQLFNETGDRLSDIVNEVRKNVDEGKSLDAGWDQL